MIRLYQTGSTVTIEQEGGSKQTYQSIYYLLQNDVITLFRDYSSRYPIETGLTLADIFKEDGTAYATIDELINAINSFGVTEINITSTIFENETASLSDGSEIDTGFINARNVESFLLNIRSDQDGLTLVQEDRLSDTGNVRTTTIPLPQGLTSIPFQFAARESEVRFRLQNNSGTANDNVVFNIKTTQVQPTVTPLAFSPLPQSQAILNQSVLIGQEIGTLAGSGAVYRNVSVNQANALLTADFNLEVARGLITEYQLSKKFGRNSEVDVGTAPEDVWNGGGLYTGFDCTQAEILEFFSDNAQDSGSLVSSGTATGGSTMTLIDTGATFITDGVAVGDCLINDTKQIHGIISSVDSETQVSVFRMTDGAVDNIINESGNDYRIATTSGTGAAVCKFSSMLDANYDRFSEYIIMNGTTPVNSVGTYLRQSRGEVILAGTFQSNLGEITGRQSVTTANVTMVMPSESGQTAICCDTVPRGEIWVIKTLNIQMARANGSAGSAGCRFQVRERGGAWQTKRFPEIQDAGEYQQVEIGGIVVQEFTDVRWNIQFVSDNDTIFSAEFEYYRLTL